jgi:hypothetical protein
MSFYNYLRVIAFKPRPTEKLQPLNWNSTAISANVHELNCHRIVWSASFNSGRKVQFSGDSGGQ